MNRLELERKVFEAAREDMALIGVSDSEIYKNIAEASDNDLLSYLEEVE